MASEKESRPKPILSTLQTPVSASYPSEIRSPLPGTPAYLIREDNVKTPITPPHAYLDFLKTMSPALMSPAPTAVGSHFTFPAPIAGWRCYDRDDAALTSQPSLSRTTSTDSAATVATISTEASETDDASVLDTASASSSGTVVKRERSASPADLKGKKAAVKPFDVDSSDSRPKTKPQSPHIIIPPTPFIQSASGRLTRRSALPGSPLSPANARTPRSARSHTELRSASCLSAEPWSASFPRAGAAADSSGSKTSKVCVRQVVTRTVTYCQTPLEPAPKGKRRKLEE